MIADNRGAELALGRLQSLRLRQALGGRVGQLAARLIQVRLISTSLFALGVLFVASGLLSSSVYAAFVVLCVFMGLTAPPFAAPITALFQARIDPSKLERVLSFYVTMTMLVVPAGLVLAGPVGERTGVAPSARGLREKPTARAGL